MRSGLDADVGKDGENLDQGEPSLWGTADTPHGQRLNEPT
jgi:hypothetical protein